MRTRRMSGMRRSVVGPVAAFGAILLLLGAGRLEAGDPWLAPPFSLSAEELLRWGADARPPEAGKPLRLFDEVRTTFDAAGKRTLTFRRVQMVPDGGAIEGVGPIEAFWQPWKDLPPVLRGRVVRPDGSTSDLDQGSVADRPFKSEPGMFDDRRIRNAPLQGLEPGGVAEWETVVVEKEGFPGGRSGRLFLSNRNPARCLRVVIQVPVSSRLRWAIRGIPSFEPKVSSSGERTTYTFELLDAPASLEWEKGLPRDVVLLPWLDFSVEESWEAVAALYSSLSGAALRSLDPASLKGFPDVSKASEKEKVARILDAIRRNVRYTGLEFGLSAWIPADPRVTWERRFGDCRDQAALLVSLLRHAGVEADVALLRTGSRDDIEPEVPSLRLFDHAIVRIASVPPVWIDPTSAFDPAGRVPVGEEGRRALICRSGVKELEAIPFTSVRDNMWISRIEVRLSDEGPGAFKEVRESTGWIDSSQRATYDRLNEAERKKFLESIAAGRFGREASLARFEASPPRDLSRPFLVTIDGSKAGVAQTSHSEAVVAVDPSLVFGTLPAVAGERRAPLRLLARHPRRSGRAVPRLRHLRARLRPHPVP